MKPNLVSLSGPITAPGGQPTPAPTAPAPTPQPPAAAGDCGGDPGQLTTAQLAACVAELSKALQGRIQAPATAKP